MKETLHYMPLNMVHFDFSFIREQNTAWQVTYPFICMIHSWITSTFFFFFFWQMFTDVLFVTAQLVTYWQISQPGSFCHTCFFTPNEDGRKASGQYCCPRSWMKHRSGESAHGWIHRTAWNHFSLHGSALSLTAEAGFAPLWAVKWEFWPHNNKCWALHADG